MYKTIQYLWLSLATALLLVSSAQAGTVIIEATQDNTLYESQSGNLSNGSGNHLFVGRTAGMEKRRAVLAFKNLTGIPEGATVQAVRLHLYLSRENSPSNTINLVRLAHDWGESESSADGEEGKGADPQFGDATWIHSFFPEVSWTNAGGDFAEVQSATFDADAIGPYTIESTDQMVADVEDWIANPDSNFGWIMIGDETASSTKRFDSRDNSEAANRPMLEVVYSMAEDDPLINDFSGLWYDPMLDGEGYNVVKSEFGWIIYYYGYSPDQGFRWLVSDVLIIEDLQFDKAYPVKMFVGTPGTFNEPTPPQEALQDWGQLQILFDNCSSGTFVLESETELKISTVQKLIGIEGSQCLNL